MEKQVNPVLPQDVIFILTELNKQGFEAFVVGGCVRDCLLGREPKDWDITTNAEPQDVKKIFPHTHDTGIKHGTVTVVKNKVNYEITTYRVESDYDDCRHPNQVYFTKDLTEDLLRRDFTMNAIAYHPNLGFQDPFDGQGDITKKCIRGVGDPRERFKEDALRILRGIRFSAQLGFSLEENTLLALKERVPLITKISVERIREELEKLLSSPYMEKIPLLWESGVSAVLFPLLDGKLKEKGRNLIPEYQKVSLDMSIRWALFLQWCSPKEGLDFLRTLKFDNNTLRRVVLLLEEKNFPMEETSYWVRKKASQLTPAVFFQLLEYQEILNPCSNNKKIRALLQEILENGDCITLKGLCLSGDDLKKLGVPKGTALGETLRFLLDLVLQSPEKNNKAVLEEVVKNRQIL